MERQTLRILVPVGGLELARAATPVAARLASGLAADVILLRVVPPPSRGSLSSSGDLPPLVDLEERQADAELRRHEAGFPGLSVIRVVLVGTDPADEIVNWLSENPVDFVVMATHGYEGLRRLIRGSVTETVQHSGLAPVIVVGQTRAAEAAA